MFEKYSMILSNAPNNMTFRSNHGEVKSLRELRSVLVNKGKKFFNEHVNENENHFATWVQDVFQDYELSESMHITKSFRDTVTVLDKRIKYLELWLNHHQDNEVLNSYLTSGPFSLNKVMNHEPYEPEHQVFETVLNHSIENLDVYDKAVSMFDNKLNLKLLEFKKTSFFNRIFKRK